VKQRQVAVLGLGRFGQAVALELTLLGHEVLAVDSSERSVQEVADRVTHSAQADVTDEDALRELGIGDMDAAIVGVSGNLEVSILCTVLLQRLGVRRIVAKAGNAIHGSILRRVGAHHVVYPERETGIRLAHSFAAPGVSDYLDVAPGYGIAKVPLASDMTGKTLADLDLRRTAGVTVIALRRGSGVTLNPSGAEALRAGDELVVAGLDVDLERLPSIEVTPDEDALRPPRR
jgi:trk system potassium uptake protein